MKFKKSATTLVALMALVAANTAFAVVICSPTADAGGGTVNMPVAIQSGLSQDATFVETGPVTASIGTCTLGATSCQVSATGTPGGGPQSVTFSFLESGTTTEVTCDMTNDDGLPVELNKFSVE